MFCSYPWDISKLDALLKQLYSDGVTMEALVSAFNNPPENIAQILQIITFTKQLKGSVPAGTVELYELYKVMPFVRATHLGTKRMNDFLDATFDSKFLEQLRAVSKHVDWSEPLTKDVV